VFVTIITVALLAVGGLVADGGRILTTRREAANVAESAARAGAQAVDLHALRTTGELVLDPVAAIADAHTYLNATGYSGTVTADTNRVHVTVTIRRPMVMLSAFGLRSYSVTGDGDAIAAHTPDINTAGGQP
jgi:Flp pilus assembly protein TadG